MRHFTRLRALSAVGAVVAILGAGRAALAYFSTHASGTAAAAVGSLGVPSITQATPGAGTVSLQWSAVTAPGSGAVSYYVRRNGGAASASCGSSSSPIAGTSCTDSGLSKGSDTYTVTAVYTTWTATSTSTQVNVASGAAAKLVFSQSPAGGVTNTAFPAQPQVTVEDSSGNTVTADSSTVSLSITSGTPTSGGPGTLSGCSGAETSGVVTFSGCQIDTVGAGYKLHATDGALTAANSSAFSVSGPATRLAFTQSPTGGNSGVALPVQPQVAVEDSSGDVVTVDTSTVSLSITSGTPSSGGPGTLSGCSGTESAGVVTFSGCAITTTGAGYKLRATDGALTAADSSAFNISGAPAMVVFTQSPTSGITNTAFPVQPQVSVEDSSGIVVTYDSSTVSLTIKSNTPTSGGPGTLSGCSGVETAGVVSFTGCNINTIGTGYKLQASDGSLGAGNSSAFNVSGPAAKLVFSQSPAGGVTNTAFPTQPQVTVEDSSGNTVTADSSTVSLSITSGTPTSGGPGTLSGCSGAETSGVVTFSGCKIDTVGAGYKLHATDGALTAANSSAFSVSGPAAKLVFTTQPSSSASKGTAFGTQPVITVEDASGNTVTVDASSVTLTLNNPGQVSGASLACTTDPLSATAGVASFSGCKIAKAGTFSLSASDASLAGATSNNITVS